MEATRLEMEGAVRQDREMERLGVVDLRRMVEDMRLVRFRLNLMAYLVDWHQIRCQVPVRAVHHATSSGSPSSRFRHLVDSSPEVFELLGFDFGRFAHHWMFVEFRPDPLSCLEGGLSANVARADSDLVQGGHICSVPIDSAHLQVGL